MSSTDFAASLLAVAGILLLASSVGRVTAAALLPARTGGAEAWGWGIALASLLLPLVALASISLDAAPGWTLGIALSLIAVLLGRRFRLAGVGQTPRDTSRSVAAWLLLTLTAAGVSIYLVRSLAEPMWSNDYLAIWGLKGKAIYEASGIPAWLFRWPEFQFSNPSYPIGLPLLYAGVASLLGRWDDHAMALLFPFFQVGTLLVLVGWLRRRGASLLLALSGAAFVANLGSFYAASMIGMAEVPLAFTILLVGTAAWDVLDETNPGAMRRLALASLLAGATKNEGLFLLASASLLLAWTALRRRRPRLWAGAAAVAIPGAFLVLLHGIFLGRHPERAIDISMLWRPGLTGRLAETLREEWAQLIAPIWPGIVAVAVLLLLAPARSRNNPALILCVASTTVYLLLPAICPFGPAWLVRFTVGRIVAAFVPLLATGVAMAWSDSGRLPRPAMAGLRAS